MPDTKQRHQHNLIIRLEDHRRRYCCRANPEVSSPPSSTYRIRRSIARHESPNPGIVPYTKRDIERKWQTARHPQKQVAPFVSPYRHPLQAHDSQNKNRYLKSGKLHTPHPQRKIPALPYRESARSETGKCTHTQAHSFRCPIRIRHRLPGAEIALQKSLRGRHTLMRVRTAPGRDKENPKDRQQPLKEAIGFSGRYVSVLRRHFALFFFPQGAFVPFSACKTPSVQSHPHQKQVQKQTVPSILYNLRTAIDPVGHKRAEQCQEKRIPPNKIRTSPTQNFSSISFLSSVISVKFRVSSLLFKHRAQQLFIPFSFPSVLKLHSFYQVIC